MRGNSSLGALCVVVSVLWAAASARAQQPGATDAPPPEEAAAAAAPATEPERSVLATELAALSRARLLHVTDASETELAALVERGQALSFDGADADAVALLLEALESPRFADFVGLPAYAAAEHAAARALIGVGSLATARRYLQRAIARGAGSPFYGPSVRAYVDVALDLGDAAAAARFFEDHAPQTPDARDELRYLRARARYDAGEHDAAEPLLAAVGEHSRFHPSARYLLGAIAAERKQWTDAEKHFCAVAGPGKARTHALYVDGRYFDVLDLARLGLGRVAHEQRRGDDAFYYYFQVPRDSARLQESLFEGAYARYESHDHEVALDLLDQLDAHFPSSSRADEAAVLRGYVALGRCDFERADAQFRRFVQAFEPLLAEIDRALDNPARRRALADVRRTRARGGRLGSPEQHRLLSLLSEDPALARMHDRLQLLDAEAARGGRVADELEAVAVRVQGAGAPRPGAAPEQDEGDAAEALQRDLELARELAQGVAHELDALRAARVPSAQTRPLERELGKLAERLSDAERAARRSSARGHGTRAARLELAGALAEDAAAARSLPERLLDARERLSEAIDAAEIAALAELRGRIDGQLQRARIGRIDAVMGSKRRIEQQIESLAAGRFPPELRDPLLVQGLLADDEEYWPFEGEDWPDEYEERYDEPGEADRGELEGGELP